jgi:hypothetical protein
LLSWMLLEFAMTNAGWNMLSTKNLPEPVNSTVVPLSMKIPRSMAKPECKSTGQSTTSVNAPCLAAAKAFVAPVVSSVVPLQETQAEMDFLFVTATGVTGVPDAVVVEPTDVAEPLVAGVTAAVLVAVDGVVVVDVFAGTEVVVVAVDVVPAMAVVTVEPTVLLLVSVVSPVLAVPDRSTVPVAVPVAAVLVDAVLAAGAVALVDAVLPADAVVSLELPCMEPHAARGRIRAADKTRRKRAPVARRGVTESHVTYA